MEPCDIINCFYFMEKMNGYEAPVIEIIEVEVEKGFAGSDPFSGEGGKDNPL